MREHPDPIFRSDVASPLPPPQPGGEPVLPWVLAALEERAEMGKAKYGQYLLTHDGRSTTLDALQEAMDLVMYLAKKYLEERDVAATTNLRP